MSVLGNQPAEILVLGLGNVLLQDEGVGIHSVTQLQNKYQFDPEIDILDGGTAGLDLLPEFNGRKKMIIIDAVEFKQDPGYIGLIRNDDILAQLQTKLSIHHLGLADLLSAARMLGEMPDEVVLVGVQPESLNPALELTDSVASKLPRVLEAVLFLLDGWGVKGKLAENPVETGVLGT